MATPESRQTAALLKELLKPEREAIDDFDDTVLMAVAQRSEPVISAGKKKRERGLPIFDPDREESHMQALIQKGEKHGLPESVVREIFTPIFSHARSLQTDEPKPSQVDSV